jgi:hypothetical protein
LILRHAKFSAKFSHSIYNNIAGHNVKYT